MRYSNFILWLIPAILLGSCSNKTEKKDAPSIKVSTEILAKDNASLTTTFVGQAEAASTSAVSFPTAGTILKVTVNEGQEVRKGQLLAEIDPSTMRKALKSAEAVLAQARDAYDRMKFLHDTNSLPEIQWVEAQSKLAQAQAAYDIANKNLNDCRLYSPVNGTIGQKMVQAGETVMPGQPIVTIVDINTVKVNVSVPEKEIGDIKSDTPSTITVDALGKRKFLGGRIAKNVQSDLMTHTYSVSIEVGNPSHKILPEQQMGGMADAQLSHHTLDCRSYGNSGYLWAGQNAQSGISRFYSADRGCCRDISRCYKRGSGGTIGKAS